MHSVAFHKCVSESTTKICMKIDPYYQRQKCSPGILVSSKISFMLIQAATSLRSVTACLWRHSSSSLGYSFRHAAAAAVTLFFVFFYIFFYFSSLSFFVYFFLFCICFAFILIYFFIFFLFSFFLLAPLRDGLLPPPSPPVCSTNQVVAHCNLWTMTSS